MPKNSREKKAGTRKKLQMDSIHQDLLQWKESGGYVHIIEQLLAESEKSQQVSKSNKKKKYNLNVQACKKKLSQGHYTTAIKVLSSNGIALDTADTL